MCRVAEHHAATRPGHEEHGGHGTGSDKDVQNLFSQVAHTYRVSTVRLSQKIHHLLIFYTGYFPCCYLNSFDIWILKDTHNQN